MSTTSFCRLSLVVSPPATTTTKMSGSRFSVVAFCLLALFASIHASNVADLNSENFDEFIASNQYVLAEFFAPWCGHCKRLAPEYEEAANKLKEENSPVRLAKIDCTVETTAELAERFSIQGFPTLMWFVNGEPVEYTGPREAAGIVGWIAKKTGPATTTVTSKDELKAQIEKGSVVVGFFEKDSEAHKAFVAAASSGNQVETLSFVDVLSDELIKEADEKVDTVKVYRTFADPIALDKANINKDAIVKFALAHAHPYFEHAQAAWSRLMARGIDYVLVIVADTTEASEWDPLSAIANKLAQEYIDKVGFAYVGKEFFDRVGQFGLSGKNFPAAFITEQKRDKNYIHDEDTPLTEESLKNFIDGVLDGSIAPHFKSQEAPESNDGPVTVVVGTTFDELVIKNDKDVLVEFYAPWCGHCKHLEPIYTELGNHFAGEENVVIAKLDATSNDFEGVVVKSFPTIYLFPAGSKSEPISYEGSRTVDAFVSFLNQHATHLKKKDNTRDEL